MAAETGVLLEYSYSTLELDSDTSKEGKMKAAAKAFKD